MKRLILILAVLAGLTGCIRYDIEEILLLREDISLTVKGVDQVSYSPETFQIGHDADNNIFRVFDDDLANWFVLTCDERPVTEGQEVTAELSWTASNTTRSRSGLLFRVEKTGPDGYIWLWCKNEAIGIVVREL